MRLTSHIPIDIDVDGDTLKLGVKRLSYEEAVKLKARYREALKEKNEETWGALYADAFRKYLRFETELVIECSDGDVEIKNPGELLDIFGGRPELLNEIFVCLISQNSLSDLRKKALALLTASRISSAEQGEDQVGPKQEPIAESAEPEGSAETEDATSQANDPSGSEDPEPTPSSSSPVPSFH